MRRDLPTQMKFVPEPRDGVYVLRVPTVDDIESIEPFVRGLRAQARKGGALCERGALVLILTGDADLDALDEDAMREHGWVRRETGEPSEADIQRAIANSTDWIT